MFCGIFFQESRSVVGGVVVHNYDVESEFRLLCQCAVHGVANRLLTVSDRYYHRCLACELLLVEVRSLISGGVDECSHLLEMRRDGFFHLHLHLTVARVDIVELLLAACAGVALLLCIEIFVEMEDGTVSAYEQAQVVQAGIHVVGISVSGGIFLYQPALEEHHASEVEVVAQAARLIVYHGVCHGVAVLHRIVVAVYRCRIGLGSHPDHPSQSIESDGQRCGLGVYHRVFAVGILGDAYHRCRRHDIVYDNHRTSLWSSVLHGEVLRNEQVYVFHCPAFSQLVHRRHHGLDVGAWQKTVCLYYHGVYKLFFCLLFLISFRCPSLLRAMRR